MTCRKINSKEAYQLIPSKCFIKIVNDHPKWRWITLEEWRNEGSEEWKNWDGEKLLLPSFIVDDRYICGFECGYGFLWVVDLLEKDAFISKDGIFQENFVYLGDYYSYPDGAFYYRVL